MRLRVTNSGLLLTRSLRSGKSSTARLREFFLGETAFKTSGYWPSLRKDPFWNVTEVLQLGQLPYRTSDVKKNFTAYVMAKSWMQLLL